MTTAQRALQLIAALRKRLDEVENTLADRNLSEEKARRLESMLVARRWPPNFMGLTGPSGHDPQVVYQKCDQCDHYRLR